jgi:FHA domain
MDTAPARRDTRLVASTGSGRRRIGEVLNEGFAQGLLSARTHAYRVDLLYGSPVVDRRQLIGDLNFRDTGGRWLARVGERARALGDRLGAHGRAAPQSAPLLLALDDLARDRLLVGRHVACDVVLSDPTVSRHHAQLVRRDGSWVLRDLASTNGTAVNGTRVARTRLRCGDLVAFGNQIVQID